MSQHFTATIEINETTHTEASSYRNESKPASREVKEVVRLTLRADSLEKLQAKLAAHVALIEN